MSDAPPTRTHRFTRQAFLLSTALSVGAAAGPRAQLAFAQTGGGDSEILKFALTLELLEARFYERGLRLVEELSEEERAGLAELRDNEFEHVRVLSRLIRRLGATPVTEPQFDFGDAFSSNSRFFEVAQQLEELGVGAYQGAMTGIADRQVLAVAGAIAQVEARHSAVVRLLREEPVAPDALDRSLARDAVVERVEPFLAE
jgi:rubrerythrin